MIFAEVLLAEATGAVLAHSVMLDGRRVPKGTVVDAGLAAAAADAGLSRLWIARIEAGDVPEAEAAGQVGAMLAGTGVIACPPVHGRVNLHARHDGLLRFDPRTIAAANAGCEDLGIATLPPDTPLCAGDLLATVKIIPFAMAAGDLEDALALRPLLEVLPWRNIGPVLLLQTLLPDGSNKVVAKTAAVTRARLARFDWTMVEAKPLPHAVAPLAAALAEAQNRHGLVLIAGATATADRRDVIPAAILAAGGTVTRVGMPVDPGNLLVLGHCDPGTVVIGLPGCAKSPKRNGLDLVLEQMAAFGSIEAGRIADMGVGGLLEESGVPVPWGWRG